MIIHEELIYIYGLSLNNITELYYDQLIDGDE